MVVSKRVLCCSSGLCGFRCIFIHPILSISTLTSIHLLLHPLSFFPGTHPSMCLPTQPCISPSISPTTSSSILPLTQPPIFAVTHLPTPPPIVGTPSHIHPSVHLPTRPSIHPFSSPPSDQPTHTFNSCIPPESVPHSGIKLGGLNLCLKPGPAVLNKPGKRDTLKVESRKRGELFNVATLGRETRVCLRGPDIRLKFK